MRVSDKIRESAQETDDLASRGGPEKLSPALEVPTIKVAKK